MRVPAYIYIRNLTSSFWVLLLKTAHPSRVYIHTYWHQTAKWYVYQSTGACIYTWKDPPLVGNVHFHQEFGKRHGNGNINLQRYKQFYPLSSPTRQAALTNYPSSMHTPKGNAKFVFRIIAITFLGPFRSGTWDRCRFFRSHSLMLLQSHLSTQRQRGTMVANRWRIWCILHNSALHPHACVCVNIYVHNTGNPYTAVVQGVRITPKGNIELGFPYIYCNYIVLHEPSWVENEMSSYFPQFPCSTTPYI